MSPTTPMAIAAKSSLARRTCGLASMADLSPAEHKGRADCESPVNCDQGPKRRPVFCNVVKARSHLVDADQAVDRRRARECAAGVADDIGDRLYRPRHADRKKEGQARGNE